MMVRRLSSDVRRAVLTSAAEEAQRRGDRRLGTEHLLLGLLDDPNGLASRFLAIDLESAREASTALDRAALSAVGVDLGSFDQPSGPTRARRRPWLTSGARSVLERSVHEAQAAKARRIEDRHLLLGLLACKPPDPAFQLLAALGIDPAEARERLISSAR
jgi:ATP-dependent Clp protease ATP-binding subunit ClpA